MSLMALMILPIFFFLIGVTVYSFFMGTSWIGGLVSGTVAGALGAFVDSVAKVGYVFKAGLSNFFAPDYWGMTLFAIGLSFVMFILAMNILVTFSEDPEIIR